MFAIPRCWLLGGLLALALPLFSNELDWWKHNHTGAAIVTINNTNGASSSYAAAYRVEDFDIGHTPELGMVTLERIYLVSVQGVTTGGSLIDGEDLPTTMIFDGWVTVTVYVDYRGHAILSWPNWSIDFTPVNKANRDANRALNSLSNFAVRHMIIKKIADAELITMTDR